MTNPFDEIARRLTDIEEVLLDLKNQPVKPPPAHDIDELLTPEEAAKLLKVSKVTVWQWSKPKPGILNPRRIGNQVRYLKSEVLAAARPAKGGASS